MITVDTLKKITGGKPDHSNMTSLVVGLERFGKERGLDRPHRLAHFIAQVAHESGRFKYDREVWGPTAAQKRYEGRADLGNTQPGDGQKFSGRTPMQVTGRYNYISFRDWCRKHISPNAPDFAADPDAILTDPWEGLAPIWYWDAGTSHGSLNSFADDNNIEAITRKINGGLNGFADRTLLYTRSALVLIGYTLAKGVVARFQSDVGLPALEQDDIAGAKTRGLMHKVLVSMYEDRLVVDAPEPAGEIVSLEKLARLRALSTEMNAVLASIGRG